MEDQAEVTDPSKTNPSTGGDESMIGRHAGPYRIERELGRGGMGTVYEARRVDGEFQHRVAIKLVNAGLENNFVIKRFRNERQILAALDHPNIGRLLGGGTTEAGEPYFVMEYIDGQPLYKYAETHQMNIPERLRLFIEVCGAVQYAHEKLVIHRDIKPTNIMVTANGTPKLLDFGIAKLLNPQLVSDTTPQTTLGVRLMTIEYASPEQVQAQPVTFRSDVYSLGVILFELLTSHSPYRFRNLLPHEVARAIIEDEPELPSIAITRPGSTIHLPYIDREADTLSDNVREQPQLVLKLRDQLTGDLDNIILKALRKEPAQRYESVAAFRDDLVRHLNGAVVEAPVYAPSRKPEVKSIAILPLKIMKLGESRDTGDEFLGIGLTDAMITRLSGVRSLAVRPTSAIAPYGDESVDPLRAGRELGVDYVLDGRIKTLGNRVRITLQLLDIRQAANSWAHQFDETFSDALKLEDSISQQVAESLLPQLTDTGRRTFRKRGTDNPRAFEAYLRGRFFWNSFMPDLLPRAFQAFEEATKLDPGYALAYVGLADFYNWGAIYGILSPAESHTEARHAAQRAIELDESLGEAYATLGFTVSCAECQWAEAERLFHRAFELNPNYSLAHEWYSSMLIGTGRFDEGLFEIKRAEELDPLSLRQMALTSWSLYQMRDYQESIAKAQQIIDLDRANFQGHLQIGNALLGLGEMERGLAELRECARLAPVALCLTYLCFALGAAGLREEAEAVRAEMIATAPGNYVKEYFLALTHVALGEYEEAINHLEKTAAERDPWHVWFGTEPKLDPLRDHQRFIKLFRSTNNPLAFRETANPFATRR